MHTVSDFWNAHADKIMPEPNSGCWFWLGALSRGYGSLKNARAHRVAYEMTIGPIPEGLVIDHLCRVTSCVNPDHLEAVTQAENVRRGLTCFRLSPEEQRQAVLDRQLRYRRSPKGKAAKRRELDKLIAARQSA